MWDGNSHNNVLEVWLSWRPQKQHRAMISDDIDSIGMTEVLMRALLRLQRVRDLCLQQWWGSVSRSMTTTMVFRWRKEIDDFWMMQTWRHYEMLRLRLFNLCLLWWREGNGATLVAQWWGEVKTRVATLKKTRVSLRHTCCRRGRDLSKTNLWKSTMKVDIELNNEGWRKFFFQFHEPRALIPCRRETEGKGEIETKGIKKFTKWNLTKA